MPIAYLITCFLAFTVWKVPFSQLAAASIDGLLTAASILYIILGAILLLNLQQESGAIFDEIGNEYFYCVASLYSCCASSPLKPPLASSKKCPGFCFNKVDKYFSDFNQY